MVENTQFEMDVPTCETIDDEVVECPVSNTIEVKYIVS